ncbi:MAG: single-stranded DNA-binding protein [Spirochaetota bacterium]
MATDINSVVLIGRLTRDAELRYSNSGTAICKFSIANSYSRRTGDTWSEETNFFDAVLMGRRAEALHKYLVKGKQVGIKGELRQDRWEQDGQRRSRVEIFVNDVNLLGGGQGGGGDYNRGAQSSSPQGSGRGSGDDDFSPGTDFEDDVPF